MAKVQTLKVVIAGDSRGAQDALGKVDRSLAHTERASEKANKGMGSVGRGAGILGKGLLGVGGAAAIGLGGAALGLGMFIKDGMESLQRVETINKQTQTVIKSTGGSAKVSAQHVADYANSIEQMSGIEAESVQEGQNMLLTFTDIQNRAGKGNDIFDQATSIMTDMSKAMGTDMKGQAIQLGKALNDPVKGVSALSKVGVTFTKQQKDQIAAMVKAGDVAGAQKVILKELNKEFGGSAKAFGETTQGKIEKAKNALGNFQEALSGAFMPLLGKLAEKAAPFFQMLADKWPEIQARIGAFFAKVKPIISKVFGLIMPLFKGGSGGKLSGVFGYFDTVKTALQGFAQKMIPIIQQFATFFRVKLIPLFSDLWAKAQPVLKDLGEAVAAAWDAISAVISFVVGFIQRIWAKFGDQILGNIKRVFGGVFAVLGGAFKIIKGIFEVIAGVLTGNWGKAWQGIKDILGGAWGIIKGLFDIIVGTLSNTWTWLKGILLVIWDFLWGKIKEVLGNTWAWIKNVVLTSALWVHDKIMNFVNGVRLLWSVGWNAIKTFFLSLWNSIKSIAMGAFNWVKDKITTSINFYKAVWSAGWNAVKTAFSNIWSGIKSAVGSGVNWVKGKFNSFVSGLKAIPGRMKGLFSGAFDGLKSAFKSAVNGIISGWNDLSFKFPSFSGDFNGPLPGGNFSVGGWVLNTPNIPMLAKGGLVKATPGGILATLGEGGKDEAVIPLDKAGLMGVTVNVTVNVRGSIAAEKDLVKTIAVGVRDEISRIGKRNGGSTGL